MTAGGWNVRRHDRGRPPGALPGMGPIVVLDNIRSAFNVGAIFRTCDAANVRQLYLTGITAHPPNPKLLKAALGAEEMVPWTHALSALEVVRSLQGAGTHVVSVELTDRSRSFHEIAYPPDVAFVFGHEVAGVAVPILEQSDRVVQIPMLGCKNSLNVGTSVGIVLFELVRRRLTHSNGA